MTTQVTQCPNCNTSFRVTDAQLEIANGAVRCGSCLNIFQAQEYWLDQQQNTAASQPSQSTNSTTSFEHDFDDDIIIDEADELDSLDSIFEDGDFDDDNYLDQLSDQLLGNEPDNTNADETEQEPSPEPEPTNNTNDEEDEPVEFDDILIDDDDPIIDDNLLIGDTKAQSIINIEDDLQELEHTETEEENDGEFSSFFLELDEEESKPATVYKELDDIGDEAVEEHESWAKQLLEEAESDDENTTEAHKTEHPASDQHIDNEFDNLEPDEAPQEQLDPELLDILNDSDDQLDEVQEEYILGDTPLHAGERIGEDKQALLANIEPEPVELATTDNKNLWLKRMLFTGVIAALLLLAVQYLSFNFERLARDANYRPLLAKSCSIVGCKLPELYDVSLVRSSNLMVRSHAETPNALIVDAIITNHADFKQPFPVMELQFKSLSGEIVAGRHFQPEEYLAGELLGSQTMPIKQPIHIALEIIDPGESAVNYQMIFHAGNH
jgi:predicted Zn finger-like uncharacterized protein